MKRFIITKSFATCTAKEIPTTQSQYVFVDGKTTRDSEGKPIMREVAIPAPPVGGNARIFEGESAPTNEQMSVLFAPAAPDPVNLAQAKITNAFPVLVLLDGQSKIFQHTLAGTLASIPKTIAVATWVETVKQTALAGSTAFPAAPFTVSEVLAE